MASLLVLGATPVRAHTKADFATMRKEINRLRNEVTVLKKAVVPAAKPSDAKPADSSGWGDRIEPLEIKSKDAVVLGDIGGGFRLPGSETSIRLYGCAEAHAIHDAGRAAPDDNFTILRFQPVGSEVLANLMLGQEGKTKLTAQTSHLGFETSTPTCAGSLNTQLEMDFYGDSSDNRDRLRLRLCLRIPTVNAAAC